jgi:DNA-binding Xre family transcriptional regulator
MNQLIDYKQAESILDFIAQAKQSDQLLNDLMAAKDQMGVATLAENAGVSRQTVYALVQGKKLQFTDTDTLLKLMAFLSK